MTKGIRLITAKSCPKTSPENYRDVSLTTQTFPYSSWYKVSSKKRPDIHRPANVNTSRQAYADAEFSKAKGVPVAFHRTVTSFSTRTYSECNETSSKCPAPLSTCRRGGGRTDACENNSLSSTRRERPFCIPCGYSTRVSDSGIHAASSTARAKRDATPSSGLSGDAIVIAVLEEVACLAMTVADGERTRAEAGGDARAGGEHRIYTRDYEIVSAASLSMPVCSAVAGIDPRLQSWRDVVPPNGAPRKSAEAGEPLSFSPSRARSVSDVSAASSTRRMILVTHLNT